MRLRLPKTRGMLRREAARWIARLEGSPDSDTVRQFRRWHDCDPRHSEAYARVRRSYEQAGLLSQSALAWAPSGEQAPAQRRPMLRPALAAAAALLVLAPAAVMVSRSGLFAPTSAMMLATGVGEIRTASLGEGSQVVLDTSTRIEIEDGPDSRRLRLKEGRVRITVGKGRPAIIVETPVTSLSVQEGTADVEYRQGRHRIEVLSGSVDLASSADRTGARSPLKTGDARIVQGDRILEIPVSPGDWTRGMLQFDATPLAEAIARANLYSEQRIRLGQGIEHLPVTGAYRAGDTAGLAQALAAAFRLTLQRDQDGTLRLSRDPSLPMREKEGG